LVIPSSTNQLVIARAAIEDIDPLAAVQHIVAATGVQIVVAEPATERVVATATQYGIVADPTIDLVVAGAAVEGIIPAVADDLPPINQVGSRVKISTGERREHGTQAVYGGRDHRAVTNH
jgi:hypothetical protein